ncbi:MAG: DUF86 domain-containing protein [Promethearchaeota archaeon]
MNDIEYFNKIGIERQFAIYHAFQINTEIITDLTAMLVKDSKITPKDDYTNIEILRQNKVISRDLSDKLREIKGLRNRIVHNYNGLIDKIALERIINLLDSMEDFINGCEQWLKKNY